MLKAKNAASGSPTRRRVLIAGAGAGIGLTTVTAVTTCPGLRGAAGARALKAVFGAWTDALARTTGSDASRAARLTATVGIGPGLPARLGLRAPAALRDLPPFPGDRLDPAGSGGDVLVQLCADSTDSTEATGETLTRLAGDALHARWRQDGFLPPASDGGAPRRGRPPVRDRAGRARRPRPLPRAGGRPRSRRRCPDAAPRLLLRRQPHRPGAAVPRVHAGPRAVRPGAAQDGRPGRAERLHGGPGLRGGPHPAGGPSGAPAGRGPAGLTGAGPRGWGPAPVSPAG
ncbi:Dyp-type peroxidase, partial [Streptomyces sp. MBT49]|nr:Dyp-type peroxidase [Streptomyces sp. MBT49]